MSYIPTNFEPTIIDENTKQISQPSKIKTELKPHQLAMIYQMNRMETPVRKKLKLEEDGDSEYTFETNFGCLCDKVGSGKSLTVLGLIANKPILTPSNRCYTTYSGVVSIFKKNNNLIPINLLVVPHGIMNQWTKYIENDTSLDFITVKNKKTLEKAREDITAYQENPLENLHLIQTDLYLVSSSMYNKFVSVFNKQPISIPISLTH